jgi:hypothetical protein
MNTLLPWRERPGLTSAAEQAPNSVVWWRRHKLQLLVAAAAVLWATQTSNPLLTPVAIAILSGISVLLWKPGEPPVLLFACAMQWIQAAAAIFYTNFYGISLTQAFGGAELTQATWLSLAAVLILAVSMRLALGRHHFPPVELEKLSAKVSINNAFAGHVLSFVVGLGAVGLALRIPGLSQALHYIGTVKWVFVFILACAVLEQGRGYFLLAISVVLEVATGLMGFFAGFKEVFFVLLMALLSSSRSLQGRRLAWSISVAVTLVILGSLWTSIKTDYRDFLSQGFRSQEVVVPVEERVGKLQDLMAGFGWKEFTEGFEVLIMRLSYVQYFGLTIVNVPANVPYENGALWLGAVKHTVTPRLFFPDKPIIEDSERTSFYTGLQVAGAESGTSIGIGYVGESYIDFGPIFMFVPIAILGFLYGLLYRAFVLKARWKLIGTASATSILVFGAYTIETSNIKIVGGNTAAVLFMTVLYLILGRTVTQWLIRK